MIERADTSTHTDLENESSSDTWAVLPVVDLHSGTVELRIAGTWEKHPCTQAERLLRTLQNSADPPGGPPKDAQLIVTVARRGSPEGHEIRFFYLTKGSAEEFETANRWLLRTKSTGQVGHPVVGLPA